MIYKAAIIGCGNIAGGYDRKIPTRWSATHAGAYHLCKDTQLVAVSDTNASSLKAFKEKWQVGSGYLNYADMLDKEQIDILSICLPTQWHYPVFKAAMAHDIKAVFLEKPLSNDLDEAIEMAGMETDTIVSVNYFRRWNPSFSELIARIKSGEYGKALSVTVHYNKGLFLNGSHFIDLMRWMWGEPVKIQYLDTPLEDKTDLGIDFRLEFDRNVRVSFINIPASYYNFAQIDILLEKQRIVIGQRGQVLQYYPIVKEPHYNQFDIIGNPTQEETLWRNCTTRAVREISDAIRGKGRISCTLKDGLRVLEICHELVNRKRERMESV